MADIPQDQVEAVARVLCPPDMNYVCAHQPGFPCSACRREAIAAIRVLTPLIAAVEREKLAAWMILNSIATGHGDTIEDLIWALTEHINRMDARFESAAAVERERCAKIADERVKRAEFGLVLPQIDRVPLMIRREEASIIAESIRSVKGAVT